ncbi:MAG: xylulokinase [Acetobacteraceae bacterium]
MTVDLVIGLDSSTTATKAIAWNSAGTAVAVGRAAIPMRNPMPGHYEQDAADWWNAACASLRELAAKIDPARIAGLAIANQRETIGFFAADGAPLRSAIIWLDDRAGAQVERFGAEFGAERVHAISGKPLDVIPCLYRLIWLRENEPEVFRATDVVADVHGYLCFRLTARWSTSTASADPMGMLDMERLDWSEEIIGAAGIPRAKLLPLQRPGMHAGEVTPAAAAATGLRAGTPVFTGGGDGQCAGAGVGTVRPGSAYINLGTAVVSGSYSPTYVHDRAFRTETAVAEDGYICETCLRAGTFLIDWLVREMFGIEAAGQAAALSELERQASALSVGAGGILLLPYWQGSMTPHWDMRARGVVAGISGSSRRADLFRAVLEGIALDLACSATRAGAAIGREIEQFIAIGGGATSDLWMQIIADATARPVLRSTTIEASSLGAAMAAAKGVGWFPTIAEAASAMVGATSRRFMPDAGRVARYAALRDLHAELWPALAAWNRRLRAFNDVTKDPYRA